MATTSYQTTNSYRLGSPRSSRIGQPTPLSLSSSSFKSPPTLLYDLPPSSSRSPPLPARSPPPIGSPNSLLYSPPFRPTSPETHHPRPRRFEGGVSSASAPSSPRTRPTPPPPRSSTPLGQPFRQDLDTFASHCRSWYFQQDEHAGRLMTQTLANLPPSQRAPFSRLQAQIRSSYHTALSARRTSEYNAHLSSTLPGNSLSPTARLNPTGELAQKERYNKLDKFIKAWCAHGMPGTKPFFDGLWAAFRLQALPENLGGAGSRRIEWQIDDAVFREAAGKDFMMEAIDVLKGVLAFEESLSSSKRRSQLVTRAKSPPIIASTTTTKPRPPPPPRSTLPNRTRASSDPFLDAFDQTNTRTSPGSSSPLDDPITPPVALSDLPDERQEDEGFVEGTDDSHEHAWDGGGVTKSGYMRTWVMPDLSNPEINSLLTLFPTTVNRGTLPRFSSLPSKRRRRASRDGDEEDLEIGDPRSEETVTAGTGKMWIGSRERSDGWSGNWWTRFVGWVRRMFC